MRVIGRTIRRVANGSLRDPLLLGALLAVAALAVLTAPCEHRVCDGPAIQAASQSQAHAAPLPASDGLIHCGAHCGFLLTPPLIALGSSALATREPPAVPALRPRLLAPPLIPPPQHA